MSKFDMRFSPPFTERDVPKEDRQMYRRAGYKKVSRFRPVQPRLQPGLEFLDRVDNYLVGKIMSPPERFSSWEEYDYFRWRLLEPEQDLVTGLKALDSPFYRLMPEVHRFLLEALTAFADDAKELLSKGDLSILSEITSRLKSYYEISSILGKEGSSMIEKIRQLIDSEKDQAPAESPAYLHDVLTDLQRRTGSLDQPPLLVYDGDEPVGILDTHNDKMKAVLKKIRDRASQKIVGLIVFKGDSGTGKELYARYYHQISPRRLKPLVTLNLSGSPPSDFIEDELFGHVKGAYPGATEDRPGKLEAADGGMVFIDEAGKLDKKVQARLLRFLEYRTLTRIGSNEEIKVDVRIIMAMSEDPRELVKLDRMGNGFYNRIADWIVEVPSLQDRPEDLDLLMSFLIYKNMSLVHPEKVLPDTVDLTAEMGSSLWDGNIRSLRNRIMQVIIEGKHPVLSLKDIALLSQRTTQELSPLARETETSQTENAGHEKLKISSQSTTPTTTSNSVVRNNESSGKIPWTGSKKELAAEMFRIFNENRPKYTSRKQAFKVLFQNYILVPPPEDSTFWKDHTWENCYNLTSKYKMK
jgi:DNA-binding NtrC family response regulator